MRLVRRTGPAAVPTNLLHGLLPTDEELERARHLSARFAGAGLREVQLVELHGRFAPRERWWLALESMQITGSFKVRGALFAIERRLATFRERPGATPDEPFSILAVSAGNHGVGVAHAAKFLGVKAEIVVPKGAPRAKVKKIEAAGATVIESSSTGYDRAEMEAIQLAEDRGIPLLSPYDDLDIVLGNGASLGFEIVSALGKVPDQVHCPIGGGGLTTGLACSLNHERRRLHSGEGKRGIVVPVQSEASCAFATSLERGAAVIELPPAETLAEGLEGGISERAFIRASALVDDALVCTEEEIEHAMRYALKELGLILEGSAAVALVPALAAMKAEPSKVAMSEDERNVVVVLTGRNVDADRVMRLM